MSIYSRTSRKNKYGINDTVCVVYNKKKCYYEKKTKQNKNKASQASQNTYILLFEFDKHLSHIYELM